MSERQTAIFLDILEKLVSQIGFEKRIENRPPYLGLFWSYLCQAPYT